MDKVDPIIASEKRCEIVVPYIDGHCIYTSFSSIPFSKKYTSSTFSYYGQEIFQCKVDNLTDAEKNRLGPPPLKL